MKDTEIVADAILVIYITLSTGSGYSSGNI